MEPFLDHLKQTLSTSALTKEGYWQSGVDANRNAEDTDTLTLTLLSQYTLLSVIGPDNAKFLQGQTTCDWTKITTTLGAYGSYCNLKGRVMCSFLGFMPAADNIQLRMRSDILDSSREILAKYIVFSKAKLHHNSDQLVGLGVAGPRARQALAELVTDIPDGQLSSRTAAGGSIIQLDSNGQRFECWLDLQTTIQLWEKLAAQARIRDSASWERDNITAGIGEVCALTQDLFLPQMLNYQLIGAVSFTKGCYTGQEIVARMQYRGKLKRRMYRAQLPTAAPAAGAELYADDDAQSVGNIVSAVDSPRGCELLAVIASDALARDLHLKNSNAPLQLASLPYSVEA